MTILLRLLNPKLQFVPYGKGRIHARWNGFAHYDTSKGIGVDLSRVTMCGRPITNEMQPMSEREIDVQKLCQNCYSSLRTYGPQVELVRESEVVES